MIPRPETEFLVETVLDVLNVQIEQLKQVKRLNKLNIADIGTGSGCIAIALSKTLYPKPYPLHIYATDISDDILKIAKKNTKRHRVLNKITFLKGGLFKPLKNRKIDIVVANLPYLTTKQWLSTKPDIRLYEPREALDGGKDGLDYIEELLYQVSQRKDIKTIILEIGGKRQANRIKKLAKDLWHECKIKIKKDLRGLDRVTIISIR